MEDDELTATEIGKRVGLDPSTTFRMLVALHEQSLVERDAATGKYGLGVTCLELGSKFLKRNKTRHLALRALEALRERFGETVHLCVLDGTDIVYIEKLPGLHPIGLMSSHVGGRAPAYCTAVGKAMLAFLPDWELARRFPHRRLVRYTDTTITDLQTLRAELINVRRNCYAVDTQEYETGVKCVAAPIFDNNEIVAGVSVSGPIERMDEHIAKGDLVAGVQETAVEISKDVELGQSVDRFEPQQLAIAGKRARDLTIPPAGTA